MAAIDWDMVVLLASDMSAVDEDAQTEILAYVNAHYDADIFNGGEDGAECKMARIHLAIHRGYGSLPGAASSPGAVTAETGGGLSVTYAVPEGWDLDDLKTSAAGRFVLSITGSSLARVWVPLGDVRTSCSDPGWDW